jgi:trk system potassium uptake protein TrkA
MSETKRIVIAGMGEIGENLAGVFGRAGHEVTVIDLDDQRLATLQDLLDISTCLGHAANTAVLARAGTGTADLFITTTSSDATNLVAVAKARDLGVKKTVALVKDVEFFDHRSGIYPGWIGHDLVLNPRYLVAQEIHKLIRTRGAVAVQDFADNRIEMLQFVVARETPSTGRPLSELTLPRESLIVGIRRGGDFLIPRGDDVVRLGDELLVVGRIDLVPQVAKQLGRGEKSARKVVVLGGGTVGFVLAQSLSGIVPEILLIERDRVRCEFLARELEAVTVVHGDGTEVDLLKENGIESCEVFAAVAGNDERSIIASRLAKSLGARRAIALVARRDYTDVCEHLGLEVVLSPRDIIAREVLRALMPRGVLGVTPVMGGQAEFLEILTGRTAEVAGKALKDCGFPRGSVVCALLEGPQFTFPRGDTVIHPGMRAIVFCLTDVRPDVEARFGV